MHKRTFSLERANLKRKTFGISLAIMIVILGSQFSLVRLDSIVGIKGSQETSGISTPPLVEWKKTYGDTSHDERAYSLVQTKDGGYALAGWKTKRTGMLDQSYFWLVKTDAGGNQQWTETYGKGILADGAYSVIQTADGGFALAGVMYSYCCLIKTNPQGSFEWGKTYGGAGDSSAHCVIQTNDGGYVLAGSYGIGGGNGFLVKVDANGTMEWSKTYSGVGASYFWSIVQCGDGGYAVAGSTTLPGVDNEDFWLVKIDPMGNSQWNKTYGGPGLDRALSIIEIEEGDYMMAGTYDSGGYWLVKTDSLGNMLWNQTCYGSRYSNGALQSCVRCDDGGYALVGPVLVKADSMGNFEWSADESGNAVVQTSDGGLAIAGEDTLFDNQGIDHDFTFVKFAKMPSLKHDLTLASVEPNANEIREGDNVSITEVIQNNGNYSEEFEVRTYANTTIIQTQTVTDLTPEAQVTLYVIWNTSGFFPASYTIRAEASVVPGETHTADNIKVGSVVIVIPHYLSVNIAVILSKFSDNIPAPKHDANFYLQGIDALAAQLQRYYLDTSYDRILMNLEFLNETNGAWKYSLDNDRTYYGSGKGDDPSDVNNRENQFTVDSIGKADADVNFNSFDIIIVLHSGYDEAQGDSGGTQGDMWSQYFPQTVTTMDGDTVNNRIVLSEMDPMGTWAHEIGHALGKIITGTPLYDYYGSSGNGDVGEWDLMGSGSWRVGKTGDRPSHMSAYNKRILGLINSPVKGYGTYDLNSLEMLSYGDSDNTLVFYPGGLPFKPGFTYYLVESRTAISSYGQWQNEWWAPDSGIVLYEVTERSITLSPDIVNKITLPNHDTGESTLKSSGDYYLDPFSLVNFSFVQKEPRINGYYSKVAINPWTPLDLAGVRLSKALSEIVLPFSLYDLKLAPDLHLHAFTEGGKHIGINYSTGLYENQVEGAVASGDLVGADEWIFVPSQINVTYMVSSRDTADFLEAYPQYQSQFQQQSFNITYIYFDQTGNRYDSKLETLAISPNSTIQFSEVHDTAISNVVASKTSVVQGETVPIDVTVRNEGTKAETFQVTCYAGNLTVGSQSVTLTPSSNTTLAFLWDTINVAPSDYKVAARAELTLGEIDQSDNELDDGSITVMARSLTVFGFPVDRLIAITGIITVSAAILFMVIKKRTSGQAKHQSSLKVIKKQLLVLVLKPIFSARITLCNK